MKIRSFTVSIRVRNGAEYTLPDQLDLSDDSIDGFVCNILEKGFNTVVFKGQKCVHRVWFPAKEIEKVTATWRSDNG